LPRKTDSDNPADWLYFADLDLGLIGLAAGKECFYEPLRGKLAEALEKVLKAELIRLGWQLRKTHDLEFLSGELRARGSDLLGFIDPLTKPLAEAYFIDRYPGFDLDDPDWPALRAQFAAVTALAAEIRRRLISPPP